MILRVWRNVFFVVAALLFMARLCLGVVTLPDDATTMLILKAQPSFTFHLQREPPDARVLWADENGFPDNGLLEALVGQGWVIVLAAALVLSVMARRRR